MKEFRKRFIALEFSQKLCVFIMVGYALFVATLLALRVFIDQTLPVVDIFDRTIILPVIEASAYAGMKGVENVQKIIKSKAESLLKITNATTETDKTSDTI